jgi:hypothetical protein
MFFRFGKEWDYIIFAISFGSQGQTNKSAIKAIINRWEILKTDY